MNLFKKITLLFCFSSLWSIGQISFYNTYSDGGFDVGEGVVQLPDSSYLVTGSSSSFTSSAQAFIMQVDSMGNRLWSKNYGGLESEKGRRIFHVPNDGIYVAGQTNSFGNFHNVYFFKTDLSGNLIYEKNYGSASYENIHDAVMLKDTSFILVGETYNTSNESENIYLLRINKLGDTLWTKNFGTEQKDVARTIKLLNDTTVIIGGEYFVTDSLTQKAMLLKMDIDGTVEWLKTYGNLGKYVINDLTIDSDNLRCAGFNQQNIELEGANMQYILRCDTEGTLIFDKSEIHDGNWEFKCIAKYGPNNNDFYLANKFENSSETGSNNGESDITIYRFDQNLYYNNFYHQPSILGNDIPNQLIATSDGGAILVGENNFPTANGSNILLAKIGPNEYYPYIEAVPTHSTLVGVNEQIKKSNIQIYPNPTVNFISIEKKELIGTKYVIFNNTFKEISNGEITNSKISIEPLPSGSYFIQIGNSVQQFIKL